MLEFAKGSMRTYMILAEKVRRWNKDPEIQGILKEISVRDRQLEKLSARFSAQSAKKLLATPFDREGLGRVDLPYERLDQLTTDLLLGVR